MSEAIEFWFELASTYSYPAAARVARVVEQGAATVHFRPFLLGPIFKAQGWNDSPFNIYAEKGRYMWRDLARRCGQLGLPLHRPSQFPRNGLRGARLCTALLQAGEGGALVRLLPALYEANFARDLDIADPSVLGGVLTELDLDATRWLTEAEGEPVRAALRERVQQAAARGVFGAPTFVVDGELFWGEDRLDAALALADVPTSLPGLRVRPYRPADREALLDLWRRCDLVKPTSTPQLDIDAKYATQPSQFLVAERDGAIVGSCMGGSEGRRGWLNYLAVLPDHRRAGVGRALVAGAEARMLAAGTPKINLQIRGDNAAVIEFYERLGYAREGHVSMGKRVISAPAP